MMEKKAMRDLLSDLPLSIIHDILALVPIREAVRTSILSKQWRYIWATLPCLVFDEECATVKTSLCDFVNQALLLHKGPIHEFKLSTNVSIHVDEWLPVLCRNDVRLLTLNAEDSEESLWIFSPSVYFCENLTHLDLRKCEIPPPPPTFRGFSCLRCLILHDVELSSDRMETLLSGSPLLEELVWVASHDFGNEELKIHAPNLKSLSLNIDFKQICLYAPLLVTFYIALWTVFTNDFEPKPLQLSSSCNYTKFFSSLTKLEDFTAEENVVKYLSLGIEPSHHSLVYHRLISIHIAGSGVMFSDVKQVWVVVRLITGAPNLQWLSITFDHDRSNPTPEAASISFWHSDYAPKFRFRRLKSIELNAVEGDPNELKLAEFLLASSPSLKKLSLITYSWNNDDHKSLKLVTELLSYPRASTKAKILFRTR